MALVVKDRVRETSVTQGTGTFTLDGAVTGYQSFTAIGNGNTTYYTIYLQASNEWEVGIGTYTASGTTLSRDTILASSNGGSVVNFSAGTKDVFVTYPAGRSVYYDTATNVSLNALTVAGAFAANGGATLGDASGDALTINSSAVSTPNGLNFDSDTFVIDATNNRVGIGTNAPNTNVEISTTVDPILRLNNSTNTVTTGADIGEIQFYTNDASVNGTGVKAFVKTVAQAFGSAQGGADLVFGTAAYAVGDASEKMRIDKDGALIAKPAAGIGAVFNEDGVDADFRVESDNNTHMLFVDAGNDRVGIGTSLPVSVLDVAGITPVLTIKDTQSKTWVANDTVGDLDFYSTDPSGTGPRTVARIRSFADANGTTAAGALSFWTSAADSAATEKMRLTKDGNVGIGTVTPAAKLSVDGSAIFNDSGADADFRVESDTNTHAFFVQGSDGYVGIGTSSPVSPLHVVGDIRSTGDIVLVGGAGTPEVQFFQNSGNWKIAVDNDAMQFIDSSAASERMRIDASGNVGIGTNSPAKQLDLAASNTGITTGDPLNTLRFTDTDTTSAAGQPIGRIEWYSADADTAGVKAYIQAQSTDGSPDADMVFATNHVSGGGTAERMRIQYDGNVGIGTNSPLARLNTYQVNGGGEAATLFQNFSTTTNTTVALYLSPTNGSLTTGSIRAGFIKAINVGGGVTALTFGTNASGADPTEKMRIDSSGNVGLGVAPSAWTSFTALQIDTNGCLAANDFGLDNAQVILGNNLYYDGVYKYLASSDSATRYQQSTGQHIWYTAPSGTAGDAITFTERANIGTSEMVVNNPGNDYDFRVESDTNTHRLFVDGGADTVLMGTTTNTNSSKLVVDGTISETVGGVQYLVASQADIGTAPNEIPLNQYLGALAYEDTETPALDVGTGISTGAGTICKANGGQMGGIYRMTILIDLTGLNSGGTAGDIIGVNGTALPCYIARLPAMTVLGGRMTCLETPAGGDTDIDLYSATEGTGVEDQAITALTETQIINAGAQTVGTVTYFSADPAANAYFYLVGQGTANATYTAGRFLIEIFGVQ